MEFGAREKDMNALNWKPQRINLRREYYWVTILGLIQVMTPLMTKSSGKTFDNLKPLRADLERGPWLSCTESLLLP